MAGKLQEIARRGGRDPAALLGLRELFGEELAAQPTFVAEVERALASFYEKGAEATLAEFVES